MASRDGAESRAGASFLLAQIGAHAAMKFAQRLAEHDLTPPQAGILRLLRITPGMSQQTLADALGVLPSRVVAFVDDLEARGLVRRERNPGDRRANVSRLTPAGTGALRALRPVAEAHDAEICRSLRPAERARLVELLQRVADDQGLTPGVHPGYRALAEQADA